MTQPHEEWFDVVNERDEPVGLALRWEVHARGLRHRAVLIFVFNAASQIFLQKRSMTKDVSAGLWTVSCSGHVDAGEDYDQCAPRELREEIGLTVSQPLQRLFKINASAETEGEFVWVYRCESEGPFQLNTDEIKRGERFAPERITSWIAESPQDFAPAFVFIWSKLKL